MKQSKRDKTEFSYLHEAYRYFKRKNYTGAAIILEQAKGSLRDDDYRYFLQAVCLLYSNDFVSANSVIETIQRINPSYLPFIQLKAFLGLKSSSGREEALSYYISALEKNPADKLLRRGLYLIEKSEDFNIFQREIKISDLVHIPKPKGKIRYLRTLKYSGKDLRPGASVFSNSRLVYALISVLVVILSVILLVIFKPGCNLTTKQETAPNKKNLDAIDMTELSGAGFGLINKINKDKTPEFYPSEDVLIRDFNEARRLMKNGEFNKAAIMLNKILNSNASFPVKEKSDFLIRFIIDSDDRVYENIDMKQIAEKPYLYRGFSLIMTGKAANVKENTDGTAFSVMVDYDGKSVKGICEVYDYSKSSINNGDTVEVKGVFILNIGKEGTPYILSEKTSVIKKD
jgi:tetratricopeptide (TPR) repeat protein